MHGVVELTMKCSLLYTSFDDNTPFPRDFRSRIRVLEFDRVRWAHPYNVPRILALFPRATSASVVDASCPSSMVSENLVGSVMNVSAVETFTWEVSYTNHRGAFQRRTERTAVSRWVRNAMDGARVHNLLIIDSCVGVLSVLIPVWHMHLTMLEIAFAANDLLHPAAQPWGPRKRTYI